MRAVRIDLAPDDDPAAVLRRAAGGAAGGAVTAVTAVMVMPAGAPALALIRAIVGVVALERAPGVRINAVVVAPGAPAEAVAASVAFLGGADAVTGQVIELG